MLQAKLLRALENHRITPVGSNFEREINVRVVAATNRPLEDLISEGQFREDLYYRLNVVSIELPPLRDRRQDIPLLVDSFLEQLCGGRRPKPALDPELLRFLERFDWPGNIRQLHNCVETMVILGSPDVLTLDDLPPSLQNRRELPAPGTLSGIGLDLVRGRTLAELEQIAIRHALSRYQGNRTRAARSLGISVRTLQRKLKAWQQVPLDVVS
jgi:DNA-binding NtrC family response regulator